MSCPTCGLRQWRYDETTLTCKHGHQIPAGGKKHWRPTTALIPITALATLAIDLIVRTLA